MICTIFQFIKIKQREKSLSINNSNKIYSVMFITTLEWKVFSCQMNLKIMKMISNIYLGWIWLSYLIFTAKLAEIFSNFTTSLLKYYHKSKLPLCRFIMTCFNEKKTIGLLSLYIFIYKYVMSLISL